MLFIDYTYTHLTDHPNYSIPHMTDKSFRAILDLFFRRCEYFSLTLHNLPGKTNELEIELAQYLHRKIVTTRWFSYGRMEYNPLEVSLYPVNSSTKTLVYKYYHSFFLDSLPAKSAERKQSFEDLCFFSNGKLILGTVSHEHICRIYPPDKSFKSQLMEIYSDWQTIDSDDDGEIINLDYYITT